MCLRICCLRWKQFLKSPPPPPGVAVDQARHVVCGSSVRGHAHLHVQPQRAHGPAVRLVHPLSTLVLGGGGGGGGGVSG